MERAKAATAQPEPVAPAADDEALLALLAAGLRLQSNDALWKVSGNTLRLATTAASPRLPNRTITVIAAECASGC